MGLTKSNLVYWITGLILMPFCLQAAEIEEVVVTAQKKEETLQTTAAAITALSGDRMISAGISDIRDAQMLVPSVRFQAENASTEIYIRGVGSTVDLPQNEPPTAFNFNGIYIPREGTSVPFYDISQLELLPGPQGTLYGRSALGGTVNVGFKRPVFNSENSILFEAGNYGLLHGTVVGNRKLSETVAGRVAIDYTNTDGYQESGADAKNMLSGRLSFLYEPNDDLQLYVWGFATFKDGKAANLVNKGFDPDTGTFREDAFFHDNDPWDDTRTGPLSVFAPLGQPAPEDQDYQNYMIGAQLDWQMDNFKITYIPSYLKLDWRNDYWFGALKSQLGSEIEQVTQELRFSGETDRLDWLAGLYAYDMDNTGQFYIAGFPVNLVDSHTLKGVSIFGEVTYSLSDTLRVTAGGRYSYDDRKARGRAANQFGVPSLPYSFDDNFSSIDWKAGIEYDLQEDIMLYANVETAYQPGTFNAFPNTPVFNNKVNKADLTAYTAGFKSRFLDGQLQINNELFYYVYKDLFAQATNVDIQSTVTFNAQRVEIWGDQLDVVYRPTDYDRFDFSLGWLYARNDKFIIPSTGANFNGLQLQYAPDWTVTAGYHHDFPLNENFGYIRASVDTRFESRFWGDFFHTPGTRQKPYTKTDASVTYYSANDKWSVALWIKNIEDEPVMAATAAGGIPGGGTAFLEPPRTFGVRFRVSM